MTNEKNDLVFPCTGCGLCCKKVGQAVGNAKKMIEDGITDPYVKEIAAFPYKTNESGACEMLAADNKCLVYDNRPDVCDVGKVWAKYQSQGISKENYFISTIEMCNSFMKEAGTDENFFITKPDFFP